MENTRTLNPPFFSSFSFFFKLLTLLILGGVGLSLLYSQGAIFLAINGLHNPTLDYLFRGITIFGSWPLTVIIALFFVKNNYKFTVLIIGAMLYTGTITQILKMLIHAPRPAVYFESVKQVIYTIDGYVLKNSLSFPSGHTTCVFSLAISLTFILKKQQRLVWLFLAALLVAFSRIYLSQHFLRDILLGALIGTIGGIHFIWLITRSSWWKKPKQIR